MKKLLFALALVLVGMASQAQLNTIDTLTKYVNRYIRNSPVEAFQNLRLNTALNAIINFVDSARNGSQFDTAYATNDSTLHIVAGSRSWNVTIRGIAGGGSGTTDLTFSRNSTTVTIISSTGTDAVLPAATTSNAGVMTGANKLSLDSAITKRVVLNDSVTVYYNSQGIEVYRTTDSVFSFINSLEAPTSRTAQLKNDQASPGNNKVYGTDGSGVKGWKADPAGGGSPGGSDTYVQINTSSVFGGYASFSVNSSTERVSMKWLQIINTDGEATPNGGIEFNGTWNGAGTDAYHAIVNKRQYARTGGAAAFVDDAGTFTVPGDHYISVQTRPTYSGAGALDIFHGMGYYNNVTAGTVNRMPALQSKPNITGGTVKNANGVWVQNPLVSGGGVLQNNVGIYVENMTAGSLWNAAIETRGGQVFFGDRVRVNGGELILNDSVGLNNVPFVLGNVANNNYPFLAYNYGARTNSGKYLVSDIALKMDLNTTGFSFSGATSGTAGNTITPTTYVNIRTGAAGTAGNLEVLNGQLQVNTNTPAYLGAKSSADYPEFTYNYDLRNNIYKITDEAYRFRLDNGFSFQTAASGTLGTAPTWTQRALLTDAGKFKIGIGSPTVTLEVGSTDAALLPVGTTAQRPTGAAGYIRYNSDSSKYEFHNGSAWASFGAGGAGGSSYTSSNGITLTGSDFTWGGSLTGNTTIAQGANTITYTGSGVHTIAAQVNFNNVGANARFKGDGTGANDAGMFVSGGGQIAFGNWDFSRGFSIETDGRINLLGTTALKLQGGTSAARPSTLAAGQLRYLSTSSNRPEYYNGTTWELLAYSSDIVTNPIYPWNQAGIDSANTTNATSTTVKTITIPDASRGIIEVRMDCIGTDDGTKGLTGIKRVRYKKTGGTLTLGTVEDEMAIERDGGLTTATFTITTSSNNIIIQVTGEAATNLKWKPTYLMTNNAIAL